MYFQIQIKSKTVGRNTKSPHELAISENKKKTKIEKKIYMVGNRHVIWRFPTMVPNCILGNRHQIWRFLNYTDSGHRISSNFTILVMLIEKSP